MEIKSGEIKPGNEGNRGGASNLYRRRVPARTCFSASSSRADKTLTRPLQPTVAFPGIYRH